MNISPYAKAVEAGIGNAIWLGGAIVTAATQIAPNNETAANVVYAVGGILAIANTFRVWLIRNEPAVQDTVDTVLQVGRQTESIVNGYRHPGPGQGPRHTQP